ncbi:bifunctional [glutamate--ammonia ligase]-adenylyl-L-tyrosine phosphorylase/[glutamate--ammonia-ligase] adenylyltransferase [Thiohalomonas denitrificans]|uniref:Bifunctional glutamine synthetase adenylyltransferase/adenylyl-removing enzyme n=1 Tax=Thiohalomonas denitrificans TaxID=415747 RepID=A0A1G5PRA6_9GAMM|nr:glutamate-ammonia-ligase adenylyltransferase [Thiohalomonas denitrificans]
MEALLEGLPESLGERVLTHWRNYLEAADQPIEPSAELARVWAFSDFVARSCSRNPDLLQGLLGSGDLERSYGEGELRQRLDAALDGVSDENDLGGRLRRFRRLEMTRIAWRDLAGYADLGEVTADLSALAEACIDGALVRLYEWQCEEKGTPCGSDGRTQQLVVLGMGKLGARELNFSSDVDLIFAYPEEGETRGGRRSTSNQEFFVRLGQRLITALDRSTAEGFVFRVDMRLRPFGESSTLALSFDAMEAYYQVHGREWERYAMIKARPVAGDRQAGEELMAMLKPFVFRRYVDYGAFESLRDMKGMIEREVRRKGLENNVKLGAGGIREVEFIGQAFQLIRGGREPTLQRRPILTVLEALRGFQLLPDFAVDELVDAYLFLRNTEHRLQEFADQQVHDLPEDDAGRMRVALAMGYVDWSAFEVDLRQHMRRVHEHFEQVFAAPQREHAESDILDTKGVWVATQDDEQARDTLKQIGFNEPAQALKALANVRESHSYRALSAHGKGRMDRLMPLLIGAAGAMDEPETALERLLSLISAVARRTAYLALLVENPMALSQLVKLCASSSWIGRLLEKHPQLLDELLDPRTLYVPPKRDEMTNELRQRLIRIPPDDLEQQMDALRHFKQAILLRVAAADVSGAVPLMVVSDHLTALAEVILDEVLELAWRHMVDRHGRPQCGDELACDKGFAIIAYGKMGGIELGYGSDLDLVFVHSGASEGRTTDGARPVDNAVFYARLAQRLVHLLNTRTAAGELYEVDIRLRPNGASGLLVTSVEALEDYQRERAWTWEHQALVRARPVAGDPGIAERFQAVRAEVVSHKREVGKLRREVREMREKMRANLRKDGSQGFDLKQDRGGIADIEFMVQYAVLAWAHTYPDLVEFTDNIRLLERLAERDLIPAVDVSLLTDAFRAYRARVHQLTLQDRPAVVGADEFADYSDGVVRIWQGLMEPG